MEKLYNENLENLSGGTIKMVFKYGLDGKNIKILWAIYKMTIRFAVMILEISYTLIQKKMLGLMNLLY